MLQISEQSHTQASTFLMMLSKDAVLQKGYYHRNVNFQSYVDHKHQEFVSGARVCVDPPHLRMVFDKTVVNSFAAPAVAQESAELSSPARASRDGRSMGCDSTPPLDHDDRRAGTAATPEAAGAGVDANLTKFTQHQEGCLVSEETEPACALRGCVSPSSPQTADMAWQAVLQHSMRLARDTKWTHKGLQASAASCPITMSEEHVCDFMQHQCLFNPMSDCCEDVCCSSQCVTHSSVLASAVLHGELLLASCC